MRRLVRRIPLARTLGFSIVMIVAAGVLPAAATTDDMQKQAAITASSGIVQALVVGSTAFAIIIAVACGVLFHTAKSRHDHTDM